MEKFILKNRIINLKAHLTWNIFSQMCFYFGSFIYMCIWNHLLSLFFYLSLLLLKY